MERGGALGWGGVRCGLARSPGPDGENGDRKSALPLACAMSPVPFAAVQHTPSLLRVLRMSATITADGSGPGRGAGLSVQSVSGWPRGA